MFSTPLICSSKGAITLFNTVWALAPLYEVDTRTVGGAISGYCVIGILIRPMTPRMTITMEITVDSTGLLINLSNFIVLVVLFVDFYFTSVRRFGRLSCDGWLPTGLRR